MTRESGSEAPALVRGLGARDGTLLTIGSVLGSAIFLTTSDIARAVPHAGLIVLLWVAGGFVTMAGALSYAELGAMLPEAGGQYTYLREAYGPLVGFLFGWACFFVVNSGGIAALAVAFAEYLGVFVPVLSPRHVLARVPLGAFTWQPTGGQLAAAAAIALLTWVNVLGVRRGASLQSAVTVLKVASVVGLSAVGLALPARVEPHLLAPLPPGSLAAALGVGMIAVYWGYDGWYQLAYSAGEVRDPGRNLPLGLIGGTAAVTLLYALLNLVYVRVLTVDEMRASGRVGEAAATALAGPAGGRLVSAAVLVSIFGALSAAVLACARVYLPMAADGLFFRALARVHPRYATPAASLVAQAGWATLLVFQGSYEQIFTYVVFGMVLFHAATGAAVVVLRRTRPGASRPYRTWGYPFVPGLFVLFSLALAANTLLEKPKESLAGLVLLALGLPAYTLWRRRLRGGGATPGLPGGSGAPGPSPAAEAKES